jgi:hypothetical protein
VSQQTLDLTANPTSLPAFGYSSLRTRCQLVLAALGAGAVIAAASFTCEQRQIAVLTAFMEQTPTDDEWAAFESLNRKCIALGWSQLGTYVATIVAWCMWKHRCHRNLPALGAVNLQFTPRSAVGYYFLPIFQLFKPYQAMREIRWASDPQGLQQIDCRFHRVSSSLLLVAWWILYYLACFSDRVAASIQAKAPSDMPSMLAVCYSWSAAHLVYLVASLAAVMVVVMITRRQARRAERLAAHRDPV